MNYFLMYGRFSNLTPNGELGSRLRSFSFSVQKAGDRTRTDDIQLGKLTFYH
jgi:hypothetical protein